MQVVLEGKKVVLI